MQNMRNRIKGISAIAAAGLLLAAGSAIAQDSTSGAVRGAVKDKANGELVIGATVIAKSPAAIGEQTVITGSDGSYHFASLKPGIYEVAVYYGNSQFSRKNVLVRLGKVSKVNITIDSAANAETVIIDGTTPIVDQDSTKTGNTITQDYTDNVPTGRTFGAVLGSAAGSQADTYGTSFGGSTSIENTYIVEGVNTTDPGFGTQTTNLPNEFIRETEVITGGYEAEYGRSTGGIINVVTKSGSNEFHGSVFAYWTPGAFVADADTISRAGESIDFSQDLDNAFDVGAELGGPIIKDKVWFHVGFNPSFTQSTVNRDIKRLVDLDNDGTPDVDANGFDVLERLDGTTRSENDANYYYTAKITGALTQDHQGSISLLGSPRTNEEYIRGPGTESTRLIEFPRNIFDGSVKWTSKFNNSATQIDAIVGYHYDKSDERGVLAAGTEGPQYRYETFRPLTDFAELDNDTIPTACSEYIGTDTNGDNVVDEMDTGSTSACPIRRYRVGGLGLLQDTKATRLVASLSATHRLKAAGQHRFKVGADIEDQNYNSLNRYTGGRFLRDFGGFWRRRSYYTVDDGGTQPCGSDVNGDGAPDANCAEIGAPGSPVQNLDVKTKTQNISVYAQDSWAVLPNLTINLGLRWEQQTLFTGENVQGEISPTTGEPIGDVAFKLNDMFAPRVGVSYDWTQEGRSKVFAHWGRFYESIPQDINVRAYGGEVTNIRFINPCDTSAGATGAGSLSNPTCDETTIFPGIPLDLYLGGGEELADPDLKAQFLDEIVAGVEYEILPDFKLAANYVRRELGRVIEDISTDGASTYVIANPGDVNQAGVDDLRAQADAARAGGNEARAEFLEFSAVQFENSGIFDRPNREYNALVLKADKRFSKNFFVQASYTFSKLKGNIAGLFSPETGQLDPNLTSIYDLPDLMANRFGTLPADRPHLIKVDGYYSIHAKDIGAFTIGAAIRGTSGSPHSVLAAHPVYGFGEAYVVGRGTEVTYTDAAGAERRFGRSPFTTRFDTHLAYKRMLTPTVGIEGFVNLFNLFNQQPEVDKDENYTFDDSNPIVGGDSEDLRHLKTLDSNTTVAVNPNFGNVNARQAPLSGQLGIRLTF